MRSCASDPGYGGFPIAFSLRALASPCRFRGGQSSEDHAMDRLLRNCLCAFALALLAACGAVPTLPVHDGDFGVAETFAVGESVTYDDGLVVTLVRIDDSRCAPNVQCVWAGELAPVLRLRGGRLDDTREVSLGTSRTSQAQVGTYALALGTATTTTATLTVTRSGDGTVPGDSLRVDAPQPGQTVSSPLVVRGSARGPYYFEATFPVTLLDGNGNRLVQSYAQAQGEWMTTDWVPFTATLAFPAPTTATGTLVLENANPSGDPARALAHRIPVRFATAAAAGSGVRGVAQVGPTCPVETSPPDPNCADRPHAGTFVIESVGGTRIAEVTSGADGRYSVALPPGSYQLRSADPNRLPSLAPQPFTVRSNAWTTLDLELDSGIR
jgi:hypothetical protein